MTTNKTSTMIAALALALAGSAYAADTTDHEAHHPDGAAPAAKLPSVKAPAAKAKTAAAKGATAKSPATAAMGMMDTKIQAMHDMHE